jgi:pyridoxamine 5'-phosphate oxidase
MTDTNSSPAPVVNDPLQILARWLEEATQAGLPDARAMALATAGADGRPSARIVSLKRLEAGALVFTTGLWTRKAVELETNPHAAAVFHWPSLGRQARLEGDAEPGGRELAEELFAERPREHRLQTAVSRQGEPIGDVGPLRTRLAELSEEDDRPLVCPPDWGAIRIRPRRVELWEEAADRLHDRLAYEAGADGWRCQRLAP